MIGARDALGLDIDSSYSYTFTEADQSINFQRTNDEVRIECSFSTNVLTVSIDDFSREICLFSRREIEDLGGGYPALLVHPFVNDLLRNVATRERLLRRDRVLACARMRLGCCHG